MAQTGGFSSIVFYEKFLTRTAYALLIVSVAYFSEAADPYVSEGVSNALFYVRMISSAAIAVIILPLFVTYIRKCRGKGGGFEGFVVEAFRKACARAFEVTFIFLIFLEIMAQSVASDVAGKTYVDLAIAVSVGAVGLNFWLLNRSDDSEDYEGDDENEEEDGGRA